MTVKFGFGQPLTRKEDDPLLRGAGRYIADVSPAKPLQAVVIRSRTPMPGSASAILRACALCLAYAWC